MKSGPTPANLAAVSLSEREREILDFEGSWWCEPGTKQAGIRSRFSLSPTRYYQLLSQLISSPAAVAYDPLVVRRLRRTQTRRRRARFEPGPAGERSGR